MPSPPSGDPLVAAGFEGWFGGIVKVVRRDFVPLALFQLIYLVAWVVIGALFAIVLGLWLGPDLLDVMDGTDPAAKAEVMRSFTGDDFVIVFVLAVVALLVGLVVTTWISAASMFVIIRRAARYRAKVSEALRFAAARMFPLFGWSLLCIVMFLPGVALFFVPAIGWLLAVVLWVYLLTVFVASLLGVVVVERVGIGRCFALVHPRFFPTLGRLVIVAVANIVYGVVVMLILTGLGLASDPSAANPVAQLVGWVLAIPASVVLVAASVVTYTELRGRLDRTATSATLAAELVRPPVR
ncbi:MAG: hypothetical protein J2P32_05005 [Actinobacteria bacterium]|nr:hypothetical protein [Actinomycetota bacterium]